MKTNFLHVKEDISKIVLKYLLVLGVLLVFGVYKNGIFLYQYGYITKIEILKPIWFSLFAILWTLLEQWVFKRKIEIDFSYVKAFIISLFMPIQIPFWLYVVLFMVGEVMGRILESKLGVNKICFVYLVLMGGFYLTGGYTFFNLAEASGEFVFNKVDYFLGMGVGGVATSNIVIGLIVYVFLSTRRVYKRRIFLISYGAYVVCMVPILLIKGNLEMEMICSSTVILALILVASETFTSPCTKKGQIIYSLLVGVFSAVFSFLFINEGVFIAIMIVSIGVKFGKNRCKN